jgi:hypothetical protein
MKTHRDEIYRKYAQVCTELKLLYVAITRPKNLLIIYDTDMELRKPMQKYWSATRNVEVISKKMLVDHSLIP